METTMIGKWDSWDELLLSGAIIRHGTEDWNFIAVELRDKFTFTYPATPEACRAMYEILQQRYSETESKALYEELKNTRMVEVKKSMEPSEDSIGWGSWEELLLGAAVDRHGFQDWNVIATEVQNRAVNSPYTFTPKVCKAKYENLQQRYSESDSKTLLEKLRKTRIIELKKSMEPSEDSIGYLQPKLEFLKAEKNEKKDDYENGSRNPLSDVHSQKVERVESSTKETSNETTRTNWSIFSGNCKKQRGKRKRKDYNMNEASVGDSEDDDVDSWWKKSSTSTSKRNGEVAKSFAPVYDPNRGLKKHGYEDMSEFLGYLWIGGTEWSRVELDTRKKRKRVGRPPKTKLIHQRVGAKSLTKEALTVKKKVGRPRKFVDGNSGQKPSTPMKEKKRVRIE